MGFDLSNYETVKERKKRFYGDYPDGRIIVRNLSDKIQDYALIEATIFKSADEQERDLPYSTGNALEIRDKEKSISQYGKEYESVNYTSWLENCEESAIGRALDNAGYAGNDKCSREEIEKVDRNKKAIDNNKKQQPKKNMASKQDPQKTKPSEKPKRTILLAQIKDVIKSGFFEEKEIKEARKEVEKAKSNEDLNSILEDYQSKLDERQKKIDDKAAEVFKGEKIENFKDDIPGEATQQDLMIDDEYTG
jgi:hypothetical protein